MNSMYCQSKTITFIVPAKDEERNITNVLLKIREISHMWKDVHVFVADDGSCDNTYKISLDFLESNFHQKFKIVKNQASLNQGGVFKQFQSKLNTDYVMILQGQDDSSIENLEKLFKNIKEDIDLVIPYQENWKERPIIRQFLSRLFVLILNFLFRLNLQYFNHSVIMKVEHIQKMDIVTSSYAFQAEILIRLLYLNKSYVEVPVVDRFSHKNKSNAFAFKNVLGVVSFLGSMLSLKIKDRL